MPIHLPAPASDATCGECRNPEKKAYLQLLTTKGALNLELHCDLAPRTCENFLALCEMGYYNKTRFHRSIRNFMIQVRWHFACMLQQL